MVFRHNQFIQATPGRLHLLLSLRTCNLSYLRLQNQKIDSMKKPTITLKEPRISNVDIIEYVCSKECSWLQPTCIFSVLCVEKGFLKKHAIWTNAWPLRPLGTGERTSNWHLGSTSRKTSAPLMKIKVILGEDHLFHHHLGENSNSGKKKPSKVCLIT